MSATPVLAQEGPSHWLVYFGVADVDAALEAVGL